jgi:oligoribonuclease NrnB/cAMP/cGMP phosphodiesterase (DHH superfamily)
MDEQLIKSGELPLRRRSLLPGTGFFYPDSLDEDRSEEKAKEAIDGAEAIVVTDSDADGLGCIALIRELYDAALDVDPFLEAIETRLSEEPGETDEKAEKEADADDEETAPESSVALLAAGPHSLTESLEYVAEYAETGVDVFVCDIAPDEYDPIAESLETIRKRSDRVSWYDHHQWPEETADAVGQAGVDLVVGDSDEECSTDVCLRSLEYDFDDRFTELAAVTRDHDLWLNEDPRSKDLADYAYWSHPEEYAAIIGAYGADLPDPVEDYIAHRRVEKEQLIEMAIDRAAYKSIGPWTVGVTYGRCSQNEVADGLQANGADAAVIVKPSGSASIRGSENFEQAHLVARQVEGGGHPKAAGCKPDIYDDMMDYAYHWTTEGETTKRVILAAFRRVAEDVAEQDETTAN